MRLEKVVVSLESRVNLYECDLGFSAILITLFVAIIYDVLLLLCLLFNIKICVIALLSFYFRTK